MGTAWAIRGQFGHEQAAAWAGGIGAMALVLVARRPDWYPKVFIIAVAAAVGWGITGMISYAAVVGYGKSNSFPNAWYGLEMLFVIGSIFGLIGGGLTGIILESTEKKKIKWEYLILETAIAGYLTYYILIDLIGLRMTPPRSDGWAICFGGGIALIWHLARNGFTSSIRVALYTMLWTGFGFAFGDVLQTTGVAMKIDFNMWNVMEYSIGFFGGIGWAYSVYTSPWPVSTDKPDIWENRAAFLLLMLFIPVVIFQKNFHYDTMIDKLDELSKLVGPIPNPENLAWISTIAAVVILMVVPVLAWIKAERSNFSLERADVMFYFVLYLSMSIVISYVVKGVLGGYFLSNHTLYVLNLIAILILLKQHTPVFTDDPIEKVNVKMLVMLVLAAVVLIGLLAYLSSSTHGEIEGMKQRFPYIPEVKKD